MMRAAMLLTVLLLAGCAAGPAPARFTGASFDHDYSSAPTQHNEFLVPEGGAKSVSFVLSFAPGSASGSCVPAGSSQPEVVIRAPGGSVWKALSLPATHASAGASTCGEERDTVDLAAGTWSVDFDGQGLISAHVEFR